MSYPNIPEQLQAAAEQVASLLPAVFEAYLADARAAAEMGKAMEAQHPQRYDEASVYKKDAFNATWQTRAALSDAINEFRHQAIAYVRREEK